MARVRKVPRHMTELKTLRRMPELMGAAEVSEALGVRVCNLTFVEDLPLPVSRLRATRLWLASDIRAFAEVYNDPARPRGRGAKAAA